MANEKKEPLIGLMIKSLLEERSLSMRKLGQQTGIDTATISRIVNGKQQAKPEHLQKLAATLGVPTDQLFRAAGYAASAAPEKEAAGLRSSIDSIQDVLATSNLFDKNFTTQQVQQELAKYEQYARTEEGSRIIREEFAAKVEQVSGVGPFIEQLRYMRELYGKETIREDVRAIIGSGLLYFILSADIIPDYIFPIGYVDDAIAVQLVLNRLSQLTDMEQPD